MRVIGVQYPLVLALISASSEPIPVIGPIIGAVPALAVALLDSPTQALIVLAFKVGLQQFEGQLLAPNIMRRQTDVPQLLVLFALLAGTAVGGLLGALVAIPLAGALKVVVMRIIAPALRRQLATLHGEAPHDDTDRGDAVSEGPSQGDDHVLSHLGHEDLDALRDRVEDRSWCIALCDVDEFKRYNDTYGHLAGDAVLRAVGGAIARSFRRDERTYRYGGEEFLLLLPDQSLAGAAAAVEQLRCSVEAMTRPYPDRAGAGGVTMSAGIAAFATGGQKTVYDALREADAALYRAKAAGRNQVAVYDEDMMEAT